MALSYIAYMNRPTAPTPDLLGPSYGSPSRDRRRARLERRHSQRFPFVVAVRQQVVGEAELTGYGVYLAQSLDLGMGGMRVWRRCSATEPSLPVHTPLHLTFELPDGGQLLELLAEVIFDEAHGHDKNYRVTGVRFAALSEATAQRLQGFFRQAAAQPG